VSEETFNPTNSPPDNYRLHLTMKKRGSWAGHPFRKLKFSTKTRKDSVAGALKNVPSLRQDRHGNTNAVCRDQLLVVSDQGPKAAAKNWQARWGSRGTGATSASVRGLYSGLDGDSLNSGNPRRGELGR